MGSMSEERQVKPGAGARPTAFLSYSHADQDRARQLAAALERAGIHVWWDTLIEGGAQFAKSVEAALETCDVVIVAWSRASVTSDWVLDEASQGREMRKLVPVSFDGTLPPISFRQYLSVDLLGWNGETEAPQIDAIVRGVAAVMERAPTGSSVALRHARPPGPAPADVRPGSRLSRRTRL